MAEITIQWRDENYGSVCAVAAFRVYGGDHGWTERAKQRFRGCLKRAGFSYHDGRAAYIASRGDGRMASTSLCRELETAGFHIVAGDVRGRPFVETQTL